MRDSSFSGEDAKAPSTSSSPPGLQSRSCARSNVFQLLAQREVCPRIKRSLRKLWVEDTKGTSDSFEPNHQKARDARRDLSSWVEAESLLHFSSKYCPLSPPPRSTIAAAFSPDGKRLASTHGDHTVKIIDCQTGSCLKVLGGHRRTPWVVRFHPLHPEILASGSLDHEVRLWDATNAECIGSRDFYRPIASIAFQAQGELLAVASGHKLFIWHYNRRGDASSPTIILKTRRSLRAVHFHPHGAPFLLTAEVSDLEPSDSSMTLATSPVDLRYPPPTIYLAGAQATDRSNSNLSNELPIVPLPFFIWPSVARENARTSFQYTDGDRSTNEENQRDYQSSSVRLLTYSTPSGQYELLLSPVDPNNSSSQQEETGNNPVSNEMGTEVSHSATEAMETMEDQPAERSNRFLSFGDPTSWEPTFMHGWLVGQTQVGQQTMHHPHNVGSANSLPAAETGSNASVTSSLVPTNIGQLRSSGRSSSRHRSSRSRLMPSSGYVEGAGYNTIMREGNNLQPAISRVSSEVATSLAAAAELPCTVKLRIWSHDVKDPCTPLDPERCRLTIPHAVLCSEMGAHFSPCGRFLAACVACLLPHVEGDHELQRHLNDDRNGAATSPTRHPVLAQQVMYELRIYSLEEATFGLVLASRAIRAAHCLTSIQFSPTSEHMLLAYGRRHSSLLKSLIIDGETTVPIYTILEVYRVSDMKLVRVLPSAEDEVNVACFHPTVGGGLIYGTKEGKLRILQYDNSHNVDHATPSFMDENIMEVPTYAALC